MGQGDEWMVAPGSWCRSRCGGRLRRLGQPRRPGQRLSSDQWARLVLPGRMVPVAILRGRGRTCRWRDRGVRGPAEEVPCGVAAAGPIWDASVAPVGGTPLSGLPGLWPQGVDEPNADRHSGTGRWFADERKAEADILDSVSDLLVVTGPPGAGKSTVARLLSKMFERSALVVGDQFFGFIDRGFVAPWTAEAHHQNEVVVEAAAAAAGRLVSGGYTVTYDGVIGPWFLERFVAATELARIHYVVLLPPMHVCVERVRGRVGHGFTDLEATRHMYGEFVGARVAGRHLITSLGSAELVATSIHEHLATGSLAWTIDEQASPGG